MNRNYIAAKGIVYLFMVGALAASYTHIVHLFNTLGLHGWQAYAAPIFIDGFAILGLIGRGEAFAEQTRRAGLKLQIAATTLSFIANVVAGESWGARIFGGLVVTGYVIAEMYSDKLRPAPVVTDEAKARRSAAAKKAAATRKRNAAAKARTGRKLAAVA